MVSIEAGHCRDEIVDQRNYGRSKFIECLATVTQKEVWDDPNMVLYDILSLMMGHPRENGQ